MGLLLLVLLLLLMLGFMGNLVGQQKVSLLNRQ